MSDELGISSVTNEPLEKSSWPAATRAEELLMDAVKWDRTAATRTGRDSRWTGEVSVFMIVTQVTISSICFGIVTYNY